MDHSVGFFLFWLPWVFVTAHGPLWFRSTDSTAGRRSSFNTGTLVVACGLSCPTACGISVPHPGIEPASPALLGRLLTTGPPGKSLDHPI